jgi:hypothetical protein
MHLVPQKLFQELGLLYHSLPTGPGHPCASNLLVPTFSLKVIFGTDCCNTVNQGHHHQINVATIISDYITVMILDTIAAFHTFSVALLTSLPMRQHEHLWNFSVLQRVHVSNLVAYGTITVSVNK